MTYFAPKDIYGCPIPSDRMFKDGELLEKIQAMQDKPQRTEKEEEKYRELLHEYYVTNEDIRRFWKTF